MALLLPSTATALIMYDAVLDCWKLPPERTPGARLVEYVLAADGLFPPEKPRGSGEHAPRTASITSTVKTDDDATLDTSMHRRGATAAAMYSNFQPGKLWPDTDGEPIRAHSAGLVQPHTKTQSKCVSSVH